MTDDFTPGDDELLFLPLGGAGEIGMNLNLYGHAGCWIMVDLGISFADDDLPGIDVIMPDPNFIEERRKDLLGIVLTHGHEDHLGAVQYLWPRLRCPVYATRFSAMLLRRKLADVGLEQTVPIHEVALGGKLTLGPFDIEFITTTHSILEPNALAIRTRLGTVLHTGDFKIDPEPLIGATTDIAKLRRLGDEGVLAMVCDSTNVFRPGESGSEGALRNSLDALIGGRHGRVVVTTFASNAARVATITRIAADHGRQVALVGRSLHRVTEAARAAGYLEDLPPLIDERTAAGLPRNRVLLIVGGCQGEPRSALARIAAQTHPAIRLDAGDVVMFSSKIIPGNDKAIYQVHNLLAARGIEVVTEQDHFVHVSGHPSRDELARMYQWVRPRIAVPVHGERRHLAEHVAFARELQIPEAIELHNGAMLRLAPTPPDIVGHVRSGRLALDGQDLLPVDSEVLRARRRMTHEGLLMVVAVVDRKGRLLADPRVSAEGVFADSARACRAIAKEVGEEIEKLPHRTLIEDEDLREAVRLRARAAMRRIVDKRPRINVELLRV